MAAGRTLTVTLVANTRNFASGMMSAARNADGFQNKMKTMAFQMRNVAGPAFAAAAAAAGTFAVAMAVEGVKSAAAEEAALSRLQGVLEGLGQGFRMSEIQQFIDDLQFATGQSDDQLIPSFQRIVAATGDVNEAMALMGTVTDVAASRQVDATKVAQAFSRAISTGTAGRLATYGIVVDEATAKTQGMSAAIQEAAGYMSGSASAALQTWEGQIKLVTLAAQELLEAFGSGFLNALGENKDQSNDLSQALRELQTSAQDAGETIGTYAGLLIDLLGYVNNARDAIDDWKESNDALFVVLQSIQDGLYMVLNPIGYLHDAYLLITGDTEALADKLGMTGDAAADTAPKFEPVIGALSDVSEEAAEAAAELDLLKAVIGEIDTIFAFKDAMDEAKVALSEQTGILDDYSASGRDTIESLIDMAQKAGEVGLSTATMSEKVGAADQALGLLTDALNNTQMSPGTRDMLLATFQALIDDLREAGVNVDGLQAKLDALKNKTVTVTVLTKYDYQGQETASGRPIATGGLVTGPGTSTSDSIPARLSNGEFVIRAASVRKFGSAFFKQLNAGQMPASLGAPVAMTSRSSGSSAGVIINGGITVQSAPNEAAAESLPRALRRMAWLAGMAA